MNYFLDTYGIPVYFVVGIIGLFILVLLFWKIAAWFTTRYKLSPKWNKRLSGIAVILAVLCIVLMLFTVPDYLNDGKLECIYIIDNTRLVVWFTRVDHPAGISTAYSHRIKNYDLISGEAMGRLTLTRHDPINDYHIFGPFNKNAWGYSIQDGISFLDLFETRVIADEKELTKRNPSLGDKIQIMPNNCFDPVTFGLYVYAANGDIYRIDPDLKATLKSELRNAEKHNKETCAFCRHEAQFQEISSATVGWTFDKDSKKTLLFKDDRGKELNRIDLDEEESLYATAQINNKIFLFVTRSRYTLAAIQTDSVSGTVLNRIEYF